MENEKIYSTGHASVQHYGHLCTLQHPHYRTYNDGHNVMMLSLVTVDSSKFPMRSINMTHISEKSKELFIN